MITLLLTVFLVVLISAICSMTEAALYSVPWTYIENLRKQGSATGELLYQLRSRIDQPIAAVLTLNTVANTAGAAIAGAVAANVLGADNTALFAAGVPFAGKRKRAFFRNCSECCPFCSTVPYSE